MTAFVRIVMSAVVLANSFSTGQIKQFVNRAHQPPTLAQRRTRRIVVDPPRNPQPQPNPHRPQHNSCALAAHTVLLVSVCIDSRQLQGTVCHTSQILDAFRALISVHLSRLSQLRARPLTRATTVTCLAQRKGQPGLLVTVASLLTTATLPSVCPS